MRLSRAALLAVLAALCIPSLIFAAKPRPCIPADQAMKMATKILNKDVCISAHIYDVVELPDGTRFLDVCSPPDSRRPMPIHCRKAFPRTRRSQRAQEIPRRRRPGSACHGNSTASRMQTIAGNTRRINAYQVGDNPIGPGRWVTRMRQHLWVPAATAGDMSAKKISFRHSRVAPPAVMTCRRTGLRRLARAVDGELLFDIQPLSVRDVAPGWSIEALQNLLPGFRDRRS